jgi:hypothetical protein
MQELEIEFEGIGEVKGVHFQQLKKSDKAYMYELTDVETNIKRWEVFEKIIQKPKECVIGGLTINYVEKVTYPTSNSFGRTAWCITDFNQAIKKFNEISGIPEQTIKHTIRRNKKTA